jgi:hypothetical protein
MSITCVGTALTDRQWICQLSCAQIRFQAQLEVSVKAVAALEADLADVEGQLAPYN